MFEKRAARQLAARFFMNTLWNGLMAHEEGDLELARLTFLACVIKLHSFHASPK